MAAKGIAGWDEYRREVEDNEEEKHYLVGILTITISRFFRDIDTFQIIRRRLIPLLMSEIPKEETIFIWSAGCASGEEVYSLAMIWDNDFSFSANPDRFQIDATDINERCLERTKHRIYPATSVAWVPEDLLNKYFTKKDKEHFYLSRGFSETIRFYPADVRSFSPLQNYHIILCRNLAFTYFERKYQEEMIKHLYRVLSPEGYLVIGKGESLPLTKPFFKTLYEKEGIYKRSTY
jgi:chemotaxis protein methyltransferase CheR